MATGAHHTRGADSAGAARELDGDEHLRGLRHAIHFVRTEQRFLDGLARRDVEPLETAGAFDLDLRGPASGIDQHAQEDRAAFAPALGFAADRRAAGARTYSTDSTIGAHRWSTGLRVIAVVVTCGMIGLGFE